MGDGGAKDGIDAGSEDGDKDEGKDGGEDRNMHTVSLFIFALHTHTKLPQHTTLPGSSDTAEDELYININPILIEETHCALNAVPSSSTSEPPINTSSPGPSLSMSSHTTPTILAPPGPPSSPPPPPSSHGYSTHSHTCALADAVNSTSGGSSHHSSLVSSTRTTLLSSNPMEASELSLRKELVSQASDIHINYLTSKICPLL